LGACFQARAFTFSGPALDDPVEARRFIRSICTEYNINSRDVFQHAKAIYYRQRPRAPKGGALTDDALRQLQTIKRAEELFGFAPKPKRAKSESARKKPKSPE